VVRLNKKTWERERLRKNKEKKGNTRAMSTGTRPPLAARAEDIQLSAIVKGGARWNRTFHEQRGGDSNDPEESPIPSK